MSPRRFSPLAACERCRVCEAGAYAGGAHAHQRDALADLLQLGAAGSGGRSGLLRRSGLRLCRSGLRRRRQSAVRLTEGGRRGLRSLRGGAGPRLRYARESRYGRVAGLEAARRAAACGGRLRLRLRRLARGSTAAAWKRARLEAGCQAGTATLRRRARRCPFQGAMLPQPRWRARQPPRQAPSTARAGSHGCAAFAGLARLARSGTRRQRHRSGRGRLHFGKPRCPAHCAAPRPSENARSASFATDIRITSLSNCGSRGSMVTGGIGVPCRCADMMANWLSPSKGRLPVTSS